MDPDRIPDDHLLYILTQIEKKNSQINPHSTNKEVDLPGPSTLNTNTINFNNVSNVQKTPMCNI